ncbi:MAG: hypothetical protein ACOCP8_02380 [archaeon]
MGLLTTLANGIIEPIAEQGSARASEIIGMFTSEASATLSSSARLSEIISDIASSLI